MDSNGSSSVAAAATAVTTAAAQCVIHTFVICLCPNARRQQAASHGAAEHCKLQGLTVNRRL